MSRKKPARRHKKPESPTTVRDALALLQLAGLSQAAIIDILKARGADCHQSALSKVNTGKQARLSFEVSTALLEIAREPRWRIRAGKARKAQLAAAAAQV